MEKIFLSIIIPTYDEEVRIGKTLSEVDDYLRSKNFSYEIILVDDGSWDKTKDIIKAYQDRINNLYLITYGKNRGKGYAVKQGMLKAEGEFCLFTDADSSTPIEEIEKLFPHFKEGYDIVIGSRALKESKVIIHQPWYRELAGKLGNKFIQVLVLWGIKDTQCGFKCFTQKAAKEIFKKLTIYRWGFDFEALIIAKKLGFRVKEVPVTWIHSPSGKVTLLGGYPRTFLELLKIKLNLFLGRYK